ncbi:MAG: DUF5118 domain-containing protein, partial [Balneolaceae bacterium]
MRNLLLNCSTLLFVGLITLSCQTTESLTDDSADQTDSAEYSKVITSDAITSEGVIDIHHVDDKIYYEIPDSLLGRDFLMVSRVASVPSNFFGFTSSGSKTAEQVIVFDKTRGKVNLRQRSYNSVANDTLPISRSVRANNFEPVITSFDIKATGP